MVNSFYPERMSSENPKALSLKEDYFCVMSALSEYIVHGTVPEEESLPCRRNGCQRLSIVPLKRLSLSSTFRKHLRAPKPRPCEVPRTKPMLPRPQRSQSHADKKFTVLVESALFGKKLGGWLKSSPGWLPWVARRHLRRHLRTYVGAIFGVGSV